MKIKVNNPYMESIIQKINFSKKKFKNLKNFFPSNLYCEN